MDAAEARAAGRADATTSGCRNDRRRDSFPRDRCPRCINRRVAIVDRDHGFWRCIPSAMPIAAPGSAKEHDALAESDDSERRYESVAEFNETRGTR